MAGYNICDYVVFYCVLFVFYCICNEPQQNLGQELRWEAIVQTKLFMYLFVKNYIRTQGEDVDSKSALTPGSLCY